MTLAELKKSFKDGEITQAEYRANLKELDDPSLEGVKLKKIKKIKKKKKREKGRAKNPSTGEVEGVSSPAQSAGFPRERNAIEKAKASKLLEESKEKELRYKKHYGNWLEG